jgi:xanthine dehydrogenase accessory factor
LREATVFVEYIAPPQSLVIFGAGHDAIPLVNIAAQLGWSVTMADGRPAYARPERFPLAERVVVMQRDDLIGSVVIDERTVVVVMTHNFPMDVRLVPLILSKHPRFLGLLGPRTRAERLFQQLGLAIPADVHAPVGLDIGCEAPESVALSIAADIQATLSNREGNKLMLREDPIHMPALELGTALPQVQSSNLRPSYCEITVGNDA